MSDTIILATDGSNLALNALREGLAVLRPGARFVIATVLDDLDPSLVTGTGMAGGVMSPDDYEQAERSRRAQAQELIDDTARTLGLDSAEGKVVVGEPGGALCELAVELDAAAVVIGSRGRGGIKRAVLGSVSDHVVRHSPCPVVVTHARDD